MGSFIGFATETSSEGAQMDVEKAYDIMPYIAACVAKAVEYNKPDPNCIYSQSEMVRYYTERSGELQKLDYEVFFRCRLASRNPFVVEFQVYKWTGKCPHFSELWQKLQATYASKIPIRQATIIKDASPDKVFTTLQYCYKGLDLFIGN
jgi:hypothetical protein